MPQIIVTAAVNDVEEWLKFKAEMVPAMSAVASDGASYVAMDGSDQVASTWDVPDMEAFQAAQSSLSPELAAAAERAGMIPSTMVGVHQEVGRRSLRWRHGQPVPNARRASRSQFASRTIPTSTAQRPILLAVDQ
jgi:hypothetical protein